ncbi:MAG: sensor histidine kinase [Candidatus Dadabacteria bacterium]
MKKTEDQGGKSVIKILVVDDREDNLFSIETILDIEGYTIVKANSGRNALKILLKEQDFTLILMDVQMPDMNGLETASLIYERDKLKHIPIIFITAHNQGEDSMFQGYKLGAVDFIYKPINPDLLRLKVAVFAELYRKNHQLIVQEKKLMLANHRLEKELQERKLNEEKIRVLNDQLIENNKSLQTTIEELDRFAYVASHDLQEPLRKIQVFSDKILMTFETIDGDVKSSLEKIVKASGRMQILINDLLKFSRQTFSNEDFSEVDLNEVLNDVLTDMEVDIDKSQAQIRRTELPVVKAIPSQMRQLFQNLITNSIKFRRMGVPLIINIYKNPLIRKGYSGVIVEDNGIGFESKYADDIFAVFRRLHSTTEYEGTGVGLSICKKIIQKHQGNIRAESRVNEGTKFYIDLPVPVPNPSISMPGEFMNVTNPPEPDVIEMTE